MIEFLLLSYRPVDTPAFVILEHYPIMTHPSIVISCLRTINVLEYRDNTPEYSNIMFKQRNCTIALHKSSSCVEIHWESNHIWNSSCLRFKILRSLCQIPDPLVRLADKSRIHAGRVLTHLVD